ncbi:hypothetical protein OEB96_29130 [Paraliomyxa miuraensis]|nr:hypothetical protein [Paraliomyxa miuraensis]
MRGRAIEGLSLAVLWLGGGCGDDVEAVPNTAAVVPVVIERDAEATPSGDPLLDRARRGIRDGALPDDLQEQVLQSSDPAHARAQRILLAMAEPPAGPASGGDAGAMEQPPPLLPPSDPGRVPEPLPRVEGGGNDDAKDGSRARPTPTQPSPSRGAASLGKLALRSTAKGAVLTIAAPSSLVVGVANQPASGLVRLVIESAKAGGAVLAARPRVEGAEVTGVRQGQDTVQITIQLDPGWTLGSVQPFSGGAKVNLRAPP